MSAFSREVMEVVWRMPEALDVFERMLEAPLRQVDIIDVFVTKLAINCVNFRKTFCVFTGGTSGC